MIHIVHKWKYDLFIGGYRCQKCYASLTHVQAQEACNVKGKREPAPVELDELWNRYKTHGIGPYRLTTLNPEKVPPIQWYVEAKEAR